MQNDKILVEDKFVPILCKLPKEMLPTIEIINQFEKAEKNTKEIVKYLNWTKSDNEIITYNGYGMFELEIPANFDFLIDLKDPNGGIEIKSIIKQTMWNGMLPLNIIDLGYKTSCIIEFENGIPDRINELSYYADSDFKLRFALCNKSDKEIILNKRKTVANTVYN
ncbi:hypothetical protein K8089_16115 [Aequorivita sp. F47161]|uniref:Uncharacterized protein n=1 Tax=Aequorivita vitellina TaxID=2874475 RepID=A0A9X1QX04_9FLAO|nr:hypothetical protein [Aequorivita vitellina]MCG2420548.1 hypothetical protein [Aequorivita vitellina]